MFTWLFDLSLFLFISLLLLFWMESVLFLFFIQMIQVCHTKAMCLYLYLLHYENLDLCYLDDNEKNFCNFYIYQFSNYNGKCLLIMLVWLNIWTLYACILWMRSWWWRKRKGRTLWEYEMNNKKYSQIPSLAL